MGRNYPHMLEVYSPYSVKSASIFLTLRLALDKILKQTLLIFLLISIFVKVACTEFTNQITEAVKFCA